MDRDTRHQSSSLVLDCQDEMFTYRYVTPVSHRATPRYNKEPTVIFLLVD